jgi:hypothetical protein
MKRYKHALGAVASGLLFVAAAIAPAHAAYPTHTGPYNSVDQKCRGAIAKAFEKTVKSAAKVSSSCHKSRNTGSVSATVNCNTLDSLNADSKGTFAKQQQKLKDAIEKSCTLVGATGASGGRAQLDEFYSCPQPCSTSQGVGNPMTSFTELGKCLACLAGDIVTRHHDDVLGNPTVVSLGDADIACHAEIAKNYDKFLQTIVKEHNGCQKGQDKEGNTELTPCDTSDAKGKIAGAKTAAEAAVDAACAAATLSDLDSCDNASVGALKTCLATNTTDDGDEAWSSSYLLPPTLCPYAVTSYINAGYGDQSTPGNPQSRSFLEIGWTGFAHGGDIPDGYNLSSNVSCPGSEAGSCGDCNVTGLSTTLPGYETFLRCSNDFSQRCNTLFGPDAACGGLDCVYVLGPPLPLQSAGNPTCTVNALLNDISGTANPDTGSSELNITLKSKTHTGGTTTQTHPCPVCVGDTIPRDGDPTGTCRGGLRDGEACDVDGFDATFASQAAGEGLALDCPPHPTTNISGSGLFIPFNFTTGHTELGFETKCDPPLGALDCACAVCTLDATRACRNNAECTGVGTCTTHGGGAAKLRQPNSCENAAPCQPIGDDKGQCNGVNDVLQFCDGVMRQNGLGFMTCNNNSDCDFAECDDTTPELDGCGACTVTQPLSCFLNPIVDDGDPDLDHPMLVSTFCLPPTSNSAINAAGGVPGPARVGAEMDVTLQYY